MQRFFSLCWVAVVVAAPAAANESVYKKVLPSTVLIVTADGHGSGVLVDVNSRWVVTADHVPGKHDTVAVAFPEFDRFGRPIIETAHYLKAKGLIRGKVIARRPVRDLALIELESVPRQARGVLLAADGAHEGQVVHVLGNSNADDGALFGFASGQVRNVFTRVAGPKSPFAGRVVLTSVATNPGDSGGPVVNDAGELVAVVSRGTTGGEGKQVRDISVDLSEVKALLDTHRPKKPYAAAALAVNPYEPSLSAQVATDAAAGLWNNASRTQSGRR